MTEKIETFEDTAAPKTGADGGAYLLEEQVGHILRRVHQRASALFASGIGPSQLTPTQFASLVKIMDEGSVSQNQLGRLTAMDPATMQGVVGRLLNRGLVTRRGDPGDRRRTLFGLTEAGRQTVAEAIPNGARITRDTLAPLTNDERKTFLRLLKKLR
jgi:DNA-binding MarR family transcriptional regulator